jgi:glutamyl-tRNA synthetase
MYCLKDRARTWPELLEKAHFVAGRPAGVPDEASARALDPVSRGILTELTPQLQNASWTRDSLEGIVTRVAEAHGTKLGKLAPPLRAALAGRNRVAQRLRHDARPWSRRNRRPDRGRGGLTQGPEGPRAR